ncbi:MAG: signal recognition particle protein [Bacteroidetes bacterium]|nr:signal recognition particle protein [Bacteroidota bacterium]
MFESLSQQLTQLVKKIKGEARFTEKNISETTEEIKRILLNADVNLHVVNKFIEQVKNKIIGEQVLINVTPGAQFVKILNDELISIMGNSKSDLKFSNQTTTKILVVGLQGSGKTTFSAKLANYLKQKGKNPQLIAADIYRPAAIDQLEMLGKIINVPVFTNRKQNVVNIVKEGLEFSINNNSDTIIIDTAGRLHVDNEMMTEVLNIKNAINPDEILFVVDSMTGQDAVNSAKAFNDKLNLTGIVLTKLDGDTKGGAALSICSIVQKPIKFVGVGEKIDALEIFYPERMASRILGMGDVVSLVEKAQSVIDQKEAEKLEKKLRKSEFTFEDFYSQLQQLKKMGPLQQLAGMIPGAQMPSNAQVNDNDLKKIEAIILSMTLGERNNPNILNGSRRKRIANGSGRSIQDVNKLINQFTQMQKMMKNVSNFSSMFGNKGSFKGFRN